MKLAFYAVLALTGIAFCLAGVFHQMLDYIVLGGVATVLGLGMLVYELWKL